LLCKGEGLVWLIEALPLQDASHIYYVSDEFTDTITWSQSAATTETVKVCCVESRLCSDRYTNFYHLSVVSLNNSDANSMQMKLRQKKCRIGRRWIKCTMYVEIHSVTFCTQTICPMIPRCTQRLVILLWSHGYKPPWTAWYSGLRHYGS